MCLAIPGRILGITGEDATIRVARVDFGGVVKQIHLALVPNAQVGQYVLVHVGVALTVIDEQQAAQVFAHLREAGEALNS